MSRIIQPLAMPVLPSRPLVSVLIANYNYSFWVVRALDSLLRQTYPHWEAIVCDDGSTDDSCAVVAQYEERHSRIRLVRQTNQGMAAALNTAYRSARGELVALLDADDEWSEDRLERVVARFLEDSSAGLVTHRVRAVTAQGHVCKTLHPRHLDEGWLGTSMLAGREPGLPPSSGLTFHGHAAKHIFPLPAQFRSCADKVAMDRAALLAPVARIDAVLGLYRLHGSNLTGLSGPTSEQALQRNFEFLERLWKDRADFVERQHGFRPEVAAWRDVESAHLWLAQRIVTGAGEWRQRLAAIHSPLRRAAWRVLLAAPRRWGQWALRMWWTENPWKQFFRAAYDRFAAGH